MRIRKLFDFRAFALSLSDIYNLKDDEAKGRLISLGSGLITAFYNVFITGIFYTGFLSMYGISIAGVGIVTFIPYIASCFSVFSSSILERFKRRKWIILASKVYFYGMYIVATTLMPQFVTDPDARLVWFVIILFLAYAVNALFSPGLTQWFYRFYPAQNERRTRYIALNQTFSSIMSSAILLLSGLLTDAVAGSPMQDKLILILRYVAFGLVLIDVGMQACAKEYPYPKSPKLKLVQVFTLPFKYRKFLMCMLFMFMWNFVSNLNNGTWNYHLMNHLGFGYTLLTVKEITYTIVLILIQSKWKQVIGRYSWIKAFGIASLLFAPTELLMFLIQPGMGMAWLGTALLQHIVAVGLNLSYSNILYINLPEENSTAHIAFNTIGCNLFAFLGMSLGTYISALGNDAPFQIMGLQVWGVQFTTLMRFVILALIGLVLIRYWRTFTNERDIEEVEIQAVADRNTRKFRQPVRWRIAWPWKK